MRSYVISAVIITTLLVGYTSLVLLNKSSALKSDAHFAGTPTSEEKPRQD